MTGIICISVVILLSMLLVICASTNQEKILTVVAGLLAMTLLVGLVISKMQDDIFENGLEKDGVVYKLQEFGEAK